MISKTALRSAIYLEEIPEKYKSKKLLGRGKTSLVFEDDDPSKVLIFTRDVKKIEWLVDGIGYKINRASILEEIKGKPYLLKKPTKTSVKEWPIVVLRMDRLQPLSSKNKKIIKEEIKNFEAILQRKYDKRYKDIMQIDTINTYMNEYPDGILTPFLEFISNYDRYDFDFHMGNFMQTINAEIVILDPVIDSELFSFIKYE